MASLGHAHISFQQENPDPAGDTRAWDRREGWRKGWCHSASCHSVHWKKNNYSPCHPMQLAAGLLEGFLRWNISIDIWDIRQKTLSCSIRLVILKLQKTKKAQSSYTYPFWRNMDAKERVSLFFGVKRNISVQKCLQIYHFYSRA